MSLEMKQDSAEDEDLAEAPILLLDGKEHLRC